MQPVNSMKYSRLRNMSSLIKSVTVSAALLLMWTVRQFSSITYLSNGQQIIFVKISIKTYKLISRVFQKTFQKRWEEKDIFLIKSKL